MITQPERARLQSVQDKPWSGLLNYFRTMKAEWDTLESLGYVTKRLVSTATYNGAEVWEYTITSAGLAVLRDIRAADHG
jgi:hypothetical protein